MKSYILGAALLIACASPTLSATIAEGEDFTTRTNLGVFDAGSHTISGQLHGTCGEIPSGFDPDECIVSEDYPYFGDRDDYLIFEIAEGTELTSATLTVSVSGTGSLRPDSLTTRIRSRTAGVSGRVWGPNGSIDLLGDETLTGAHTFHLYSSPGSVNVGDQYEVNWVFDFTVTSIAPAAVPLPASMPLMFAGLAGLAALRRRKKR